MEPTKLIRTSEKVYHRLAAYERSGDTMNDIIEKLLKVAESHKNGSTR
jgi:predicted CopG family antitoxin